MISPYISLDKFFDFLDWINICQIYFGPQIELSSHTNSSDVVALEYRSLTTRL